MSYPSNWGNLRPIHLQNAQEFLSSAESLWRGIASPQKAALHAPSLFLFAHSAELSLKAIALWLGKTEQEMREAGHGLLSALNRAKSDEKSKTLIQRAETAVRNNWKSELRKRRQSQIDSAPNWPIADFLPSNSDIGNELPTFINAINWLDPLHAEDGGSFRYVKVGSFVSIPAITCFGQTIYPVPQSISWACDSILADLNVALRGAIQTQGK